MIHSKEQARRPSIVLANDEDDHSKTLLYSPSLYNAVSSTTPIQQSFQKVFKFEPSLSPFSASISSSLSMATTATTAVGQSTTPISKVFQHPTNFDHILVSQNKKLQKLKNWNHPVNEMDHSNLMTDASKVVSRCKELAEMNSRVKRSEEVEEHSNQKLSISEDEIDRETDDDESTNDIRKRSRIECNDNESDDEGVNHIEKEVIQSSKKLRKGMLSSLSSFSTASLSSSSSINKRSRNLSSSLWTIEEDIALVKNQSRFGNKWLHISTLIPGKSKSECHVRFTSIQRAARREWSKEDDKMLLDLIEKFNSDFNLIRKCMPTRTINAIKTRYRELNKIKKGVAKDDTPSVGSPRQLFFFDQKYLVKYFPSTISSLASSNSCQLAPLTSSNIEPYHMQLHSTSSGSNPSLSSQHYLQSQLLTKATSTPSIPSNFDFQLVSANSQPTNPSIQIQSNDFQQNFVQQLPSQLDISLPANLEEVFSNGSHGNSFDCSLDAYIFDELFQL